MSVEECEGAYDMLAMDSDLLFAHEQLGEASGVDKAAVAFRGFDGSEEARTLSYARFRKGLIRIHGGIPQPAERGLPAYGSRHGRDRRLSGSDHVEPHDNDPDHRSYAEDGERQEHQERPSRPFAAGLGPPQVQVHRVPAPARRDRAALGPRPHKGRTRAVCSDLALRARRPVRWVRRANGPRGAWSTSHRRVSPSLLHADLRPGSGRSQINDRCEASLCMIRRTHGHENEVGDRRAVRAGSRVPRDRRHHRDREPAGQLLLTLVPIAVHLGGRGCFSWRYRTIPHR